MRSRFSSSTPCLDTPSPSVSHAPEQPSSTWPALGQAKLSISCASLRALQARQDSNLCWYVAPPHLSLGTNLQLSRLASRSSVPNQWSYTTTTAGSRVVRFDDLPHALHIFPTTIPYSIRSSIFAHSNPARSTHWPSDLDTLPPHLLPLYGWTRTPPVPTAPVICPPCSLVSR